MNSIGCFCVNLQEYLWLNLSSISMHLFVCIFYRFIFNVLCGNCVEAHTHMYSTVWTQTQPNKYIGPAIYTSVTLFHITGLIMDVYKVWIIVTIWSNCFNILVMLNSPPQKKDGSHATIHIKSFLWSSAVGQVSFMSNVLHVCVWLQGDSEAFLHFLNVSVDLWDLALWPHPAS